jgi:hypothetical protein
MPSPADLATLAARLTTDPALTPETAQDTPQAPDTVQGRAQAPDIAQPVIDGEIAVRAAAMLASIEDGLSIAQAATKHGIARHTAYRLVRHWDSLDLEGTTRNLLKLKGPQMVDTWVTAALAGALKGNHVPAKELLTHAGIIEPVDGQNGTAGTRIAIVVGTTDAPVKIQSS